MEKKTIKQHLVSKWANGLSLDVKNWNNGESMHEHEVEELVDLLRVELLRLNGYGEEYNEE